MFLFTPVVISIVNIALLHFLCVSILESYIK